MSRTINSHLLSVADGDKDTKFQSDLTGADLSERTGIALEGRYDLLCGSAEYRRSSGAGDDGVIGVNVRMILKIVGPKDCSEVGKKVYRTNPVPVGMLEDEAVQKKKYFHDKMISSYLSGRGKTEDELNKMGQLPDIAPASLINHRFYAHITETVSNKQNPMNEVNFILKEHYEANPGPVPGAEQRRDEEQEAKKRQATSRQTQDSATPAVNQPGNGAVQPNVPVTQPPKTNEAAPKSEAAPVTKPPVEVPPPADDDPVSKFLNQ